MLHEESMQTNGRSAPQEGCTTTESKTPDVGTVVVDMFGVQGTFNPQQVVAAKAEEERQADSAVESEEANQVSKACSGSEPVEPKMLQEESPSDSSPTTKIEKVVEVKIERDSVPGSPYSAPTKIENAVDVKTEYNAVIVAPERKNECSSEIKLAPAHTPVTKMINVSTTSEKPDIKSTSFVALKSNIAVSCSGGRISPSPVVYKMNAAGEERSPAQVLASCSQANPPVHNPSYLGVKNGGEIQSDRQSQHGPHVETNNTNEIVILQSQKRDLAETQGSDEGSSRKKTRVDDGKDNPSSSPCEMQVDAPTNQNGDCISFSVTDKKDRVVDGGKDDTSSSLSAMEVEAPATRDADCSPSYVTNTVNAKADKTVGEMELEAPATRDADWSPSSVTNTVKATGNQMSEVATVEDRCMSTKGKQPKTDLALAVNTENVLLEAHAIDAAAHDNSADPCTNHPAENVLEKHEIVVESRERDAQVENMQLRGATNEENASVFLDISAAGKSELAPEKSPSPEKEIAVDEKRDYTTGEKYENSMVAHTENPNAGAAEQRLGEVTASSAGNTKFACSERRQVDGLDNNRSKQQNSLSAFSDVASDPNNKGQSQEIFQPGGANLGPNASEMETNAGPHQGSSNPENGPAIGIPSSVAPVAQAPSVASVDVNGLSVTVPAASGSVACATATEARASEAPLNTLVAPSTAAVGATETNQETVVALGVSNNGKELAHIPPGEEGITIFGEHDVLSGRGGGTNVHPGNRTFRDLINQNRRTYLKARKNDKPAISRAIVRTIRELNGRFLKKDEKTGMWFEIGDDAAREKTSQALRQRAPEMRKLLFDSDQTEAPPAEEQFRQQQQMYMGMGMVNPNNLVNPNLVNHNLVNHNLVNPNLVNHNLAAMGPVIPTAFMSPVMFAPHPAFLASMAAANGGMMMPGMAQNAQAFQQMFNAAFLGNGMNRVPQSPPQNQQNNQGM
ncbi:hypothetical protein ACA910_014014 [Epithemia clementina (nom. ined.)]